VYAKYILATVAFVLAVAAFAQGGRRGVLRHPQTRTWILVALILGLVSGWLFARGL
jgi:hypothetical protein